MAHWLELISVLWILVFGVCSEEISPASTVNYEERSNCYAEAVYDELIKVIDIVKAHTYVENDGTERKNPHSPKKFQEDEDYPEGVAGLIPSIGGSTSFTTQAIVPTIFKLVGSAIALNSSGLVEGSFGFLPERVSAQITSALGSLANSILGPGIVVPLTAKPPPRRRRRTTTTTIATTSDQPSTTSSTNLKDDNSTMDSELSLNGTLELDSLNGTDIIAKDLPTTTDVLYKESSLGENPVYAAAYAPNYYVATTSYPVYANNFSHALYSAPTTTPPTTTTASTTSTDPNSYNIALPFDYMEGGIGGGTGELELNNSIETNNSANSNVTYPPPPLQRTPPEYASEYEYEEQTEEAKEERSRDESESLLLISS